MLLGPNSPDQSPSDLRNQIPRYWADRFLPPIPSDPSVVAVLPGRLAVVSCFFNPCNYRSLKTNYLRFSEQFAIQGVPHFSIELAFDDAPFFLKGGTNVVQVRSSHILWHKERLLNILLRHVPEEFDKIAWVDADVLFADPKWWEAASERLELYPLVQLFEVAMFLGKEGQQSGRTIGIARVVRGGEMPTSCHCGHPGFAWAARRTLLHRHGFHDVRILGGGDSDMAIAMYGIWEDPFLDDGGALFRKKRMAWMEPFWREVQGRVGYVPGSIQHMWHGPLGNRRYQERSKWLIECQYDPDRDVRISEEGLWEWTGANPRLEEKVRNYFADRREDD
jgi:hypothetical protein